MSQQLAALQQLDVGRILLKAIPEAGGGDQDLLEACQRGGAWAFEELYRTHGGRMKSVALNLLGTTQDAEDAVQEAFLKLYRGLAGFKGESRLSTWLYRILVNTCHDMGRQCRRRGPSVPEETAAELSSPPRDHPLRLTLQEALTRLAPLQRSVFLLYEVEGFTHAEVGEVLGIPEGTSKHALFMAKRELQAVVLSKRRPRSSR